MLLILSLFLIRAIVLPPVGERVRRHALETMRRRRLTAPLRDGPVADYRLG